MAAPLRERGVPVEVEVTTGSAFVELIRRVVEGGHDLVIKTAQNFDSPLGGLLGTTALHLMRKCPVPVYNLLLLYVFWELTGLCSFFLISSDRSKGEAGLRAASHALLVTVAGGLSMLVALLYLIAQTGTASLTALLALELDPAVATVVLALILPAVLTKSAQLPTHFWLPGAMAAPTPVSAYLHSATMVKAGIILLLFFYPILGGSPLWTWILLPLGAATCLWGSVRALGPARHQAADGVVDGLAARSDHADDRVRDRRRDSGRDAARLRPRRLQGGTLPDRWRSRPRGAYPLAPQTGRTVAPDAAAGGGSGCPGRVDGGDPAARRVPLQGADPEEGDDDRPLDPRVGDQRHCAGIGGNGRLFEPLLLRGLHRQAAQRRRPRGRTARRGPPAGTDLPRGGDLAGRSGGALGRSGVSRAGRLLGGRRPPRGQASVALVRRQRGAAVERRHRVDRLPRGPLAGPPVPEGADHPVVARRRAVRGVDAPLAGLRPGRRPRAGRRVAEGLSGRRRRLRASSLPGPAARAGGHRLARGGAGRRSGGGHPGRSCWRCWWLPPGRCPGSCS